MIDVGSKVRLKPPFDAAFPGEHTVVGQNDENGAWRVETPIGVSDFGAENLEEVTD